jgi:hypothetical protein
MAQEHADLIAWLSALIAKAYGAFSGTEKPLASYETRTFVDPG